MAMRSGQRGLWRILALIASCAVFVNGGPVRASTAALTVSMHGHPTHPVWYHDTTAVQVGSSVFVAWMADSARAEARSFARGTSSWTTPSTRISNATLNCGCTDSTGSNPNRHDTPAL